MILLYIFMILFAITVIALPVTIVWLELRDIRDLKKSGYFDQNGKS